MKTFDQKKDTVLLKRPDLIEKLHPTKNNVCVENLSIHSEKEIYWKCEKNIEHVWKTRLCNRVKSKKSNCPECNMFGEKSPHLIKEWHTAKNGNITPFNTYFKSNKKVWWQCKKSPQHEWQATPNSRSSSPNPCCPYCLGRKLHETNSLYTLFPDVAKEWDYKKNYPLTPKDVTSGRRIKVWWQCKKGHSWETSIHRRFCKNKSGITINGCPICYNRIIIPENSLASYHPMIAKEWHIKNKITAFEVAPCSKKKVWWQCKKDSRHEWECEVQSRTKKDGKGSGCPFCNDIKVIKEESFGSLFPELSKEYSSDNKIDKYEISPTYSRKVKWVCSKDNSHIWDMPVNSRTNRGMNCPNCSSFLYTHPDIAAIVDINKNKEEGIDYTSLQPRSKTEIYFKCSNNHTFKSSIMYRTTAAHPCPYCKVERKTEFKDSLEHRHPAVLEEWDYERNVVLPSEIASGSCTPRHWICSNNSSHKWEATPNARTQKRGGTNCPKCYGAEITFERSLQGRYPETAEIWDEISNGISACEIFATSNKKYFWKCLDDPTHSFISSPAQRIQRGNDCSICNSKKTITLFRSWVKNNEKEVKELNDINAIYDLFQDNVHSKLSRSQTASIFFIWLEDNNIPSSELLNWAKGKRHEKIESYWKGVRENIPKDLREKIYARDNNKCQNPYCKTKPEEENKSTLSLDHKQPFIFGGEDTEENLHTLCRSCNSKKGARTWEEFLERQEKGL